MNRYQVKTFQGLKTWTARQVFQQPAKIDNKDFGDANKSALLDHIKKLLGENGNSREWRYLNKGTHEEADRAEFERQTVQEIVEILEQLDAALSQKKE